VAIVSVVEAGDLHIEAAVGAASGMMGMTLPTGQSLAEAAGNESAELARRGESSTDPASGPFPEGPRLDVPIVVDGEQMASLDFVREIGSEGYSPSARRLAETLAEQASLAFEQERLRQDNNETALVDDRERIGRDLHDHVVQRLFAAGLGLQSSLSQINDPTIQEKVSRTIDMLDETIDDIRTAIFGLSPPTDASPRLRAQILEVAEDSAVALGFHPSLTFEGAVDNDVPETLVPEVLACVREMLSNVAHHAEATSARVSLALHDGFLVITASDDGAGIGTGTTRSGGLGNLSERARLLGGSFDISSSPTGGTQLDWRVPVDT
jgi:signal transduction histidine kinase